MLTNHQNLCLAYFVPEKSRRFQPIHPWHTYIEQDQVGQKFPSFLQCLRSIPGFSADFQILLSGQNSTHTTTNNATIIGDENTHNADLREETHPAVLVYETMLSGWETTSMGTGNVTEIVVPEGFD
jgi:hypothetical protein